MEGSRVMWQNETIAAVQRDALATAHVLLPPLELVPIRGARQTDFIEPHGSVAAMDLAELRAGASLNRYWSALECLLAVDPMTTHAQLGHRPIGNTTVEPKYYRSLVGDYATVTLILARQMMDDPDDQVLSRRLLNASTILTHGARALKQAIPDPDRLQSRLDAARLTGGTRYLEAVALILGNDALLLFALIDGRDQLPAPLSASVAWNRLLLPVATELYRQIPVGTPWTGSQHVYKAAKDRADQHRALVLLERLHELEASAALAQTAKEEHALRLIRILGAANRLAPTIESIGERLRQIPADWLMYQRVRLSSDLVQSQITQISPAVIVEQEFPAMTGAAATTEGDAVSTFCYAWREQTISALTRSFSPPDTGRWAELVRYWATAHQTPDSAPHEATAAEWTIPMLCIALGRMPVGPQRDTLRQQLMDLGAPMPELDRTLVSDMTTLLDRLGIEGLPPPLPPLVAALPPPPVSIIGRLLQRFASTPSPPAVVVDAPVIRVPLYLPPRQPDLLTPAVVGSWRANPDVAIPSAQDFATAIGGVTQLDQWLPRDDLALLYRVLSCYKPMVWSRQLGLTPEMLKARQVNLQTLDINIGWKLTDVADTFFPRK